MPYTRTTRRQRAPRNYQVGKMTTAKYDGTCATTRRPYLIGDHIIYTRKGWSINDQETASKIADSHPKPSQPVSPQDARLFSSYGSTRYFFANTLELLRAVEAAPIKGSATSKTEPANSFYGYVSYEEALDLARTGWKGGTDAIRTAREKLPSIARPEQCEAEWSFDVSGDCLDIGRAVCGEPEAFFVHHAQPGEGKILKICASVSFNCITESETITKRGATIAALVECLELQGYSIELSIFAAFGLQIQVIIKTPGQPLELDRLAFFLTHAATLRRLLFSIEEGRNVDLCAVGADHNARPTDKDVLFIASNDDILNVFRAAQLIP